jgi:hypothetical protein
MTAAFLVASIVAIVGALLTLRTGKGSVPVESGAGMI